MARGCRPRQVRRGSRDWQEQRETWNLRQGNGLPDMSRDGMDCKRRTPNEKGPGEVRWGLGSLLGWRGLFVVGHVFGSDAGLVGCALGIDIAVNEFDDRHRRHVAIAKACLQN